MMPSKRGFTGALLGCAWVALASGGCDAPGLLGIATDSGAVHILTVEGLATPAVATASLYRPEAVFSIDPDEPAAGEAFGFYLTVATAGDSHLRMRVLGGAGTAPAPLLAVTSLPEDAIQGTADSLPDEARAALRSGQGVFWPADGSPSRSLEHRFGVILPHGWSGASIRLEAYASTTDAGDPLLGDRIELARNFYYMAAIGDSVMWGNGLPDPSKFSTLVAEEIQRRTGKRVIRRVHAISGSAIQPVPTDVVCRVSCSGEVPTATTSIMVQVDLLEAPGLLDLVLVDGCINDVGVSTIITPETDDAELADFTRQACHDGMLGLLRKLRTAAPRAALVATGYFPIVSQETRVPELSQFFGAQSQETSEEGTSLVTQATQQSRIFLDTAHASIAAAVEVVQAEHPDAEILFVDPGFTESNALFATQPLLWGLTADRVQTRAASEGLTLFPEDPIADLRATACFQSNVLIDTLSCLYGSVGHPNVAGARRFADAILPALEQHGAIPPASP